MREVRAALMAVGFTATVAQIVLMRELMAAFYGNELLFGLVLAAWLAWGAVGAWGLARWALRRRPGRRWVTTGLILMTMAFPAQIAFVRGVRLLMGITPGAYVELGPMTLAVILAVAPVTLFGGFLFTIGTRLLTQYGEVAGRAYVLESIGSVLGGAAFSFLFIRWLDPFQIAWLTAAVGIAVAVRMIWFELPTPKARRFVPSLVFAILCVAAFPVGRALHDATLRWQWPDLIFAADSPYGRLVIEARYGQRIFYENGLLAFETQGTFPEEVAHPPLLAHLSPGSVLLIGGGVAGDLREILKHPVDEVTYVELDPLLIEAARTYLPPDEAAVLGDPRVRLAYSDGRLYVKRARRGFDVVILDLPEPATGALNRFYTREFFTEVRAILNPGGVFSLGLPSAENYWSPELARRNGSVYHTLRSVFPYVVVLPGEHNFFLASDQPIPTNPSVWIERMAARGVRTRWVTPAYIEYLLSTDRFQGVRQELETTWDVRINRDLSPICYYYDLVLWLSLFHPGLRGLFEVADRFNLWWIAVLLAPVVILGRWRGWGVPLSIAGIGLAEMMLEVVILFAFQVLHGYVYAEVSLIVMAFMGGLALGGGASNRMLAWWGDEDSLAFRARWALIAVQAIVAFYSGLFPFLLRLPIPAPALVFPLLALGAGYLTGMAFPLAVAAVRGEPGRAAGMLYGVDLVGGCLGAVLGAVFLIPVLGIPQTCAVIALMGIAGVATLI
ncbi:MAG TPA: hypothetical protein G4O02_03410 [Caldilineae bacterium]|nr:hypothetical protein [Caldilineae bacterium]